MRDAGEPQRSMYALRKEGIAAVNTWPPICGHYERAWMVPTADGPKVKRWIPIWITYGPSRDPETNESLDRSPHYTCYIDGREAPLEYAWPECYGRPITEAAYIELLEQRDRDDGYDPSADNQ